jgi:hypothetical protein
MSWLEATRVCHGRENLLEFRNKFHNFRSSTKFYMNFYWFKLDLVRLKLTGIPDATYIYLIFLEPRADKDLSKGIYFIIFWLQIKLVQIFELARIWILIRKKKRQRPHGLNPMVAR